MTPQSSNRGAGLNSFLAPRRLGQVEEIKGKVTDLAKLDYENDPAIITAKILMR